METKSYRSELVGLIGYPVDENPTVAVMEAGFQALDLNYRYITLRVPPEQLKDALFALKTLSFVGTHVTIPHKVSIIPYLDSLSEKAAQIGAVNTVCIRDGMLIGENTDGQGFLLSLQDAGFPFPNKKVVLLGAGGAARAIAVELALAGVSEITVVNVGKERGESLVSAIQKLPNVHATYVAWDHPYRIPSGTDLLVQATSVGLFPDPACPNLAYDSLRPGLTVCDIVPNPSQTEFSRRALAAGCKTFNGLEMLARQAAISFQMWTGKKAPVDVMTRALAREFAKAT